MPKKSTRAGSPTYSLEASGFYSDCSRKGMLYARLVRSPAETGILKSVTIDDLPEGYFLFTAKDVPGAKSLRINGVPIKLFAYDAVSYMGEPVGILAGPDEGVLGELVQRVSVNFKVVSLESALEKVIATNKESSEIADVLAQINEMPSLNKVIDRRQYEQDTEPTVLTKEIKTGLYETLAADEADEQFFNENYKISEGSWSKKLTAPQWQETTGAFTYYEGGRLHVFSPTRWMHNLLQCVSAATALGTDKIQIHKTKSSDVNATGLWRTSVMAAQIAVVSVLTGKPVKITLTQTDQETYFAPGTEVLFSYRSALTEKGEIAAMRVNIDIELGAANPFAKELTERIAVAASNYYSPKNLFVSATAHISKNPPTSVCIKSVDSQSFFAVENHLQRISSDTGIFPDELRLINANPRMPSFSQVLQDSLKNSDFSRKYASFTLDAQNRTLNAASTFFALPIRGIGLATAYNVSGGNQFFSSTPRMELTLLPDEKAVIHAISPSNGVMEIWRNTVAESLGIPAQNVTLNPEFAFEELPVVPEDALYTISSLNMLLKKCCADIQKKRFHQPLPITAKKTASPAARSTETYSVASAVVEVEVDTYTYSEKIRGIWLSVDCGEVLNESTVLSAIRLEVQQELSRLVKGATVLCGSCNISLIKSKNKSGQISGLIQNTIPAAFSSALSLALSTQINRLPCNEEQIFNLMKINDLIEDPAEDRLRGENDRSGGDE